MLHRYNAVVFLCMAYRLVIYYREEKEEKRDEEITRN